MGLDNASGDYISFVDADDWIDNNTYELLYDKIKKFNLDVLVFQMINYIENTGEFIETDLYNYLSLLKNFEKNVPFSNEDIGDILFDIAVCPVSKLYKRSFLNDYHIRFPENMIFEDNVFFYNVFLNANVISYIDKKLYYRRRHSNSVTQNISNKSFDIILATNEMLNLFIMNDWYDEFKSNLINHTFSMILEWFFKSDILHSDEFFNLIKKNFFGFNKLKVDFSNFLDEKNNKIFNVFINNDNYIDFISEYNLIFVDYDCFKNSSLNEKEYLITIIIPVYNNNVLIHRTLMSIIHQSIGFENIEVILVDDNSNDGTIDVLKEYVHSYSNIKLIMLKTNTGSSGTPRNIGLFEASSKFVLFLDHDDFLDIDALKKLYLNITSNPSDVVFGTYSVIGENKFNDIFYPNEKHGYFKNINDNERFIGFPPPSIWTKLFNKEFLIKNNILFPPILGEDAIFMSKVFFNANGIKYLNKDIICFHDLNENSTTNNITLNYLLEGLYSEKFLYNYYLVFNKEYLFRYRCEANLDFFLSQFLKSDLSRNDIVILLPIFHWFILKCASFDLKPNNNNNKKIFNYIFNQNVGAIYNFKNKLNLSRKKYLVKKYIGDYYISLAKKLFNKYF